MTCSRTLSLFFPYIDGRLEAAARREVVGHLGGCERCHDLVEKKTWLDRRIRASLLSIPVPAHLHRQILISCGLRHPRARIQ